MPYRIWITVSFLTPLFFCYHLPLKGLQIRALFVDRGSGELPLGPPPPHPVRPFIEFSRSYIHRRPSGSASYLLYTVTAVQQYLKWFWVGGIIGLQISLHSFHFFLLLEKNILYVNKNIILARSSFLCFCLLYLYYRLYSSSLRWIISL